MTTAKTMTTESAISFAQRQAERARAEFEAAGEKIIQAMTNRWRLEPDLQERMAFAQEIHFQWEKLAVSVEQRKGREPETTDHDAWTGAISRRIQRIEEDFFEYSETSSTMRHKNANAAQEREAQRRVRKTLILVREAFDSVPKAAR
ncbi:hypothetical protein AB0A05_26905 [Streptomyces sp. NPDC046374]|uniref:hypothetical protein n=1 Tax=Streptomyces sp. NPDC046374 TaxID=3154917 RepID=UPI0033F612D5